MSHFTFTSQGIEQDVRALLVDSDLRYHRSGFSRSAYCVSQPQRDFHCDLLAFVSLAAIFDVGFVALTWQPALKELGAGASSVIQQGQVDVKVNLAFKRATTDSENFNLTEDRDLQRFRGIICELISLELLKENPNVIDLLGVTWETDKDTKEVWPVLLTECSTFGNMATFLASEGRTLDFHEKWKLLCDIARACLAMHNIGIVHGDIKSENILIFRKDDTWTAKLIDFGYSCFGSSDEELVRAIGTRLWQPPENENQYFTLPSARRMDIYLFGIVVCRTMLSDALPSTVGRINDVGTQAEFDKLLEDFEKMKSTSELLDTVLQAVESSAYIPGGWKDDLANLFRLTLQHEPNMRASDFTQILHVLVKSSPMQVDPIPVEVAIGANIMPSEAESVACSVDTMDSFPHNIVHIEDHIGDLDDVDYLLHETIVRNLKSRVEDQLCPICYAAAAYQLGLCYEIGFGTARDQSASECWVSKARNVDNNFPSIDHTLKKLEQSYEPSEPRRILQVLGYSTNLPWDPVRLYEDQNRLAEAEHAFAREIRGRTESMGLSSKSRLNLMETLALIHAATGKVDEAESLCREVVSATSAAFGEDDDQTIQSQNFLAYVLQLGMKYSELERLECYMVQKKSTLYGDTDGTTLASRNRLCWALFYLGQHNECLRESCNLASLRTRLLGSKHSQTLEPERLGPRCLLALGQASEAEEQQRSILNRSQEALGDEDVLVVDDMTSLAEILLELGKLEEAKLLHRKLFERVEPKGRRKGDLIRWLRTVSICAKLETGGANAGNARDQLEEALQYCEGKVPGDHPDFVNAKNTLVSIALDG